MTSKQRANGIAKGVSEPFLCPPLPEAQGALKRKPATASPPVNWRHCFFVDSAHT